MRWSRRQVVVVAALGGAGLLAAAIAARDDSPAATAPASAAAVRTPTRAAASQPVAVTDLRLELLKSSRGALPEPERNPFRFQARPAPAPPARPAAAGPPAAATPAVRPAAPAGPPPPPPIPLRFIGLVDAPGQAGRVAILSDGRGNVFYGKEGDIIEGRYRVVRVSADSLELSQTDGRGRQVIRLSGQ